MKCEVKGCRNEERYKSGPFAGLCNKHFLQKKRHGKIFETKYDKTSEQRFWEKVDKTENCWNWVASCLKFGHGHFRVGKRVILAHRYSYELHIGPIPKDMCVLHKCDNPKCVNPDHLFLGTRINNIEDMDVKNRRIVLKGEKIGTSKLTEKEVSLIKGLLKTNAPRKGIADYFGVSLQAIEAIQSGRNWSWVE
jgi:hypothetical protein